MILRKLENDVSSLLKKLFRNESDFLSSTLGLAMIAFTSASLITSESIIRLSAQSEVALDSTAIL